MSGKSKMPSRGGSKLTRELLRKEANFGCAICGEPYLTYHHFDSPWRERPHDNPQGMIALCAKCANDADGGAYTKAQLKQYKINPYLKNKNLKAYFKWRRQNFLFVVGGNVSFGCETILEGSQGKVIWQEEDKDVGGKSISLEINNSLGLNIVRMRKNQWETDFALAKDVDSSLRGQKLRVVAKDDDTWFQIWFRPMKQEKLEEFLKKIFKKIALPSLPPDVVETLPKELQKQLSTPVMPMWKKILLDVKRNLDDPMSICILTGKFYLPRGILLRENGIKYNHSFLGSNYVGKSRIAFKFD